ncbi:MAG: class I SAM-dependent methyltransferase [Vicinamibacterales bacterium]
MQITTRETATYAEALALPQYADYSPGERYADVFASLAAPPATVLDAGCGTGKGMLALAARGFTVVGCDLTDVGLVPEARAFSVATGVSLWRPFAHPGSVEYVYCTDVLEHIPPTFTMLVVARLLEVARRGVFLSIALTPDAMGVWVGHPLHQTVRRYDEWLADLRELGTVRDARDLGSAGLYFLEIGA